MHVRVLGSVTAQVDGRDVVLAGQRLRDVLTVLMHRRGRPVAAETLLDLVWQDARGTQDPGAVYTVVARLRRLLGADVVHRTDAGYLVPRETTTDADQFVERTARAAGDAERGRVAEAVAGYRSALALWRDDDAYADVTADLVRADRARLDEQRAEAMEELARLLLDHPGGTAEAATITADLVARYPLRERPRQLAMLVAYLDHRQADALAVYRDLRRRLRDELGIEPSPLTSQLHDRMLRHDPTLAQRPPAGGPESVDGSAERAVVESRMPVAAGPPPAFGSLVGRDSDLDRLLAALDEGRRLVTLTGPGGVGKSRLLAEIATRRRGVLPMVYADLSGLTGRSTAPSAEEVVDAVVRRTGAALGGDSVAALAARIGDRPFLLLLDECEAAVDPVRAVATELLSSCARVQVLATSRRPLELPGELVAELAPLYQPRPGAPADQVLAAPAVRLLVDRLVDRGIGVPQDPTTVLLLGDVARRLDGLPLAIELAAAQAATRSLAELADLVREPLDVADEQPGRPRHRTLRDAIGWSLDRLDPGERAVLERLSVFRGVFDPAAARAVAGADSAAALRGLVRDGVVQVVRDARGRVSLRLLRPVRQLLAESADPDELAATEARHRTWYAERWRGEPRGDALIDDVRRHHDDYLAALRSAIAHRDEATLADLVVALSRSWLFDPSRAPGLRWTTAALDTGILGERERAIVQVQRSALALHHDPELVLADIGEALPVLEACGESAFVVTAHLGRALELLAAMRLPEALVSSADAVAVARTVSSERLADALGVRSLVLAWSGMPEETEAVVAEAMALVEASGSVAARTGVTANCAEALFDLGRTEAAGALLDELGARVPVALMTPLPDFLALLAGWVSLARGDAEHALRCFVPPLRDAAGGAGPTHQSIRPLPGAAAALVALGRPGATTLLAASVALVEEVGHTLSPGIRACLDALPEAGAASYPSVTAEPLAVRFHRLATVITREAVAILPL